MIFAFFADTPFQLLNCINFTWHNVENSRNNADLYIHKQFEAYPEIVKSIEDLHIFRSVIPCTLPIKNNENKIVHVFRRCFDLFFPKVAVCKWCNEKTVAYKNYDVILASGPLPFVIALKDLNKNAKVWFYDDGSGSYHGDIINTFNKSFRPLLYKLTGKGVQTIVPERLYVNNVNMCQATIAAEVMALPEYDVNETDFIFALNKVFACSKKNNYEKIVYLSQPLENIAPKPGEVFLTNVLRVLKHYINHVTVRPHPREAYREYGGLQVDRSQQMWELKCIENIDEKQVLIGIFSTAQLVPKLFFEKEPYLIFLHHIYRKTTNANLNIENIDALIHNIADHYRTAKKIFIPESIEEFAEILNQIYSLLSHE